MRLIHLLIFLLSIEAINAQYLDNKINIAFGGGSELILNNSTLKKKDFKYPSLWGNYRSNVSMEFELTYIKNKNLWLGLEYTNTKYANWEGDADIFVLTHPNSTINTLHVNSYYFPKKYQPLNNKYKWAVYSGVGINFFKIESDNIVFSENETSFSTQFSNIGITAGITAIAELTNKMGISLNAKYKVGFTENPYFIDKNLNSLAISGSIYYKLFINKYQLYE
jgi:hypothetical protein